MDLLGGSVALNNPPLLAGEGLPRRMRSYHGPTISHVCEAMPSVRARRNRQGQVPISANGSLGSEGAGMEDVMSTREPTFASPAEEREYLTKVKAELDACETKADVLRVWRAPYLKNVQPHSGRAPLARTC